MQALVKRTINHARSSSVATLALVASVLLYPTPAAHAVTLDTPALLGLAIDDRFICNFTNLDPNKTAVLNASGTSGLLQDDGVILRAFPTALSVPPGQTATTIADFCDRSDSLLSFAPACRCHFEFTGVAKSKVRAAISTNVSGSATAY